MNIFTFITLYSLYITSTFGGRADKVKKFLEMSQKRLDEDPDQAKSRNPRFRGSLPRDRSRTIMVVKNMKRLQKQLTETTKSPMQIQKQKDEETERRNPKGVISHLDDEVKKFSKKIHTLFKKTGGQPCKSNEDCMKMQCCMKDSRNPDTYGFCKGIPTRGETCSPMCPCARGKGKREMECKMSKKQMYGRVLYHNACLLKEEPEAIDKFRLSAMKNSKRGVKKVKKKPGVPVLERKLQSKKVQQKKLSQTTKN